MIEASGRCQCGAVTFTGTVSEEGLGACHCTTCRRMNAGPMVVADTTGLAFAEGSPVAYYESSAWANRSFCTRCGTSIAYHLKGADKAFVGAYLFEPPLDLPLTGEVFIDEKPADYAFAGETHKLTGPELFAMMQGGQG